MKEFKCDNCGKICKSLRGLEMHMVSCKSKQKENEPTIKETENVQENEVNEVIEEVIEETKLDKVVKEVEEYKIEEEIEPEVEKVEVKFETEEEVEPEVEKIEVELETEEEIDMSDKKHYKKLTRERSKGKIIDEIVELYDALGGIYPMSAPSRGKIFALYNDYFEIAQRDCSDCIFNDIFEALKMVYNTYK